MTRFVPRALLAAGLLLAAGGCALLGGGKPAAMYSFGAAPPVVTPVPPTARPITLLYVGSTFARQSDGLRILTETGNQAAYVAEARWVAPASELFDTAAIRRLESADPSLRVIRPGDRPRPDYMLEIDVQHFAAVYSGTPETPPEAIVEGRARLVRMADRTIVGDWPVGDHRPAAANRVTSIVAAFDGSTAAVTAQVADLTHRAMADLAGAQAGL